MEFHELGRYLYSKYILYYLITNFIIPKFNIKYNKIVNIMITKNCYLFTNQTIISEYYFWDFEHENQTIFSLAFEISLFFYSNAWRYVHEYKTVYCLQN